MSATVAGPVVMRIVLVRADAEEEARAATQLMIDLIVEPEVSRSTGPFPAFGREGDFRQPETLYPFTLMADGRMDYGALAPDEARNDVLEIRQVDLAQGGEVVRRTRGGPVPYRILSLTPLAG